MYAWVVLISISLKALGLGTILFFVHIKKLEACMAGYTDIFITEKNGERHKYMARIK